eukprot:jgi/Mesen1/6537/ME000334S05878
MTAPGTAEAMISARAQGQRRCARRLEGAGGARASWHRLSGEAVRGTWKMVACMQWWGLAQARGAAAGGHRRGVAPQHRDCARRSHPGARPPQLRRAPARVLLCCPPAEVHAASRLLLGLQRLRRPRRPRRRRRRRQVGPRRPAGV